MLQIIRSNYPHSQAFVRVSHWIALHTYFFSCDSVYLIARVGIAQKMVALFLPTVSDSISQRKQGSMLYSKLARPRTSIVGLLTTVHMLVKKHYSI